MPAVPRRAGGGERSLAGAALQGDRGGAGHLAGDGAQSDSSRVREGRRARPGPGRADCARPGLAVELRFLAVRPHRRPIPRIAAVLLVACPLAACGDSHAPAPAPTATGPRTVGGSLPSPLDPATPNGEQPSAPSA